MDLQMFWLQDVNHGGCTHDVDNIFSEMCKSML